MPNEKKNEFARLLKYYLTLNHKQQIDIVNDLGYDKSTVSSWCNGTRVPKVDVIIQLAEYLHVEAGDLIIQNEEKNYYVTEETASMAQEIFDNKELRLLFDAARDADAEDLKTVHAMLLALKRKERGSNE